MEKQSLNLCIQTHGLGLFSGGSVGELTSVGLIALIDSTSKPKLCRCFTFCAGTGRG
ncbi:hypothetical protein K432DRAFT_103087 [Lepidopterella palustris CBS 459.81]|uniref:Uncharacterized protein n=1 Tax=Lepidopterella palustris CBS 459.81 TaxID=1314670 RepID=A0A8E2E641_9PEZI|nr:hypothetical protein K432DRAFT_103087 [Lepidopterella palustris CBS 459.81]